MIESHSISATIFRTESPDGLFFLIELGFVAAGERKREAEGEEAGRAEQEPGDSTMRSWSGDFAYLGREISVADN